MSVGFNASHKELKRLLEATSDYCEHCKRGEKFPELKVVLMHNDKPVLEGSARLFSFYHPSNSHDTYGPPDSLKDSRVEFDIALTHLPKGL